jgi:hypothetical protein
MNVALSERAGPPPASGTSDGAEHPTHRLRIVGGSFVVMALLTAGGAGGWWLRDQTREPLPPPQIAVSVDRPIVNVDSENAVASDGMPDIVGLSIEQARTVLGDAGIDPAPVVEDPVPFVGESGIVVSQDPAPRSSPDGTITLQISTTAAMGDLVGVPHEAARETLVGVGARVIVERRYDPTATVGAVLTTDPPAGGVIEDDVVLTVADSPSAVFLADLRAVTGTCTIDDSTIAGTAFPSGIVCKPNLDRVVSAEYILNGRVSMFEATVGLADRGQIDVPVTFRVLADNVVFHETTLGFGASEPLSIPIQGKLRLRLDVVRAAALDASGDVRAVWGNAKLVGSSTDIDDLIAESES